MLSYRDFVTTYRELGLQASRPVILHASLSAFGEVRGGAETLLGALLSVSPAVLMPAFTQRTMLIPEEGPADNGIDYGSGRDANRMAEFFNPALPVDSLIGQVAETLRAHPSASRSNHPILSFTGVGVSQALESQSLENPLAPLEMLAQANAVVLLMGVNHTANTSIHLAEKQAGRKQYVRWALTPQGVVECPGFPGCSDGFEAAADSLASITRAARLGGAEVRALSLASMLEILRREIEANPLALLCNREHCDRCDTTRRASLVNDAAAED